MNHLIAIYVIVAVFSFKFLLEYFQWNGDPIGKRGLLGAVVLPSLLWPIIAFYLAGYWLGRRLAAIVVKLLGW
jgi:hypothetical protein